MQLVHTLYRKGQEQGVKLFLFWQQSWMLQNNTIKQVDMINSWLQTLISFPIFSKADQTFTLSCRCPLWAPHALSLEKLNALCTLPHLSFSTPYPRGEALPLTSSMLPPSAIPLSSYLLTITPPSSFSLPILKTLNELPAKFLIQKKLITEGWASCRPLGHDKKKHIWSSPRGSSHSPTTKDVRTYHKSRKGPSPATSGSGSKRPTVDYPFPKSQSYHKTVVAMR